MPVAAALADVLFIAGGIIVVLLLLLLPGRGPFSAGGTQGGGGRRWLTVSRHRTFDPTAGADRDPTAPFSDTRQDPPLR
jgi:hypothetical protein